MAIADFFHTKYDDTCSLLMHLVSMANADM